MQVISAAFFALLDQIRRTIKFSSWEPMKQNSSNGFSPSPPKVLHHICAISQKGVSSNLLFRATVNQFNHLLVVYNKTTTKGDVFYLE